MGMHIQQNSLTSQLIGKNLAHTYFCSPYIKRLFEADQDLEQQSLGHLGHPFSRQEMESWLNNRQISDEASLNQSLRKLRQYVIANIILRDLNKLADLDEVLVSVTTLAEITLIQAHQFHFNSLKNIHGSPIGLNGEEQQLSIVGMGKLGGEELNVSSDIDLIFTYPEEGETEGKESITNQSFFIKLGKKIISSLHDITEDGFVFRVDMQLRPFGSEGQITCSYQMLEDYYQKYGREWERYAWVKGRVIMGPQIELNKIIDPFVYRRYLDYGALNSMRDLKSQIQNDVNKRGIQENIKLGRGGIRKIEFIAQVYQLIRGGQDKALKIKSLLPTLKLLETKNLLSTKAVKSLTEAYRFLRDLEHRLQYMEDMQTQELPKSDESKLRVAKSMQFDDWNLFYRELEIHRANVELYFNEVFKEAIKNEDSPELNIAKALWNSTLKLEDAHKFLESLGYKLPGDAHQVLDGLKHSSRYLHLPESSRQRFDLLIPLIVNEVSSTSDSYATLVRMISVLESICRRASYLAMLTENPSALKILIKLSEAGPWLTQYLIQHPILIDELLDINHFYTKPDFTEIKVRLQKDLRDAKDDIEQQMNVMRNIKHATIFKLAALEIIGDVSVENLSDYLTELADILIEETLDLVWSHMYSDQTHSPKFAVIAYGKFGGKEMSYTSDLDIVFIYNDKQDGMAEKYARFAQRINSWLNTYTSSGVLYEIDLALRPDGASGLLVSSIDAFRDYQLKRAWTWEHQAITRARFCAGDKEIGSQFEKIRLDILNAPRDINQLKKDILDMREKMLEKHKVDHQHFDLKQDRGGIIDIEFIVQYFVLAFSASYKELTQNIGNIGLLNLFSQKNLIEAATAKKLIDAYRLYRSLQHQLGLEAKLDGKVLLSEVDHYPIEVISIWKLVFNH
ncbi:MAG: Glutamate-ammonia-ligase adenylyltransferase [Pseudomonadota bacterium]